MIQWLTVILLFRVNNFIGPMLNIIQNMLEEIIKFILIYLIILVVFATSALLFFQNLNEFKDVTQSFTTLLSASFGSFRFNIFEAEEMVVTTDFGYFFLILYMIVSNVVLLNFIIAILSNTYLKLINVSKALSLNEIIKIRSIFEYDSKYSGLI